MIQRIQTLHLLVIAALCSVLFFVPLMWFYDEALRVEMTALGLMVDGEPVGRLPLYFPILVALTTLLPVVTLLLFKRRMLQIRLCAVEAVLLCGVVAMELMLAFGPQNRLDFGSFMPASFAPIASLLFVWLAARAILRDEMLVRSLDRIR